MITLEDAAGLLSTDHDCCPGRYDMADLVRAAQAVIDAADTAHIHQFFPNAASRPLQEALAAFHAIEKGE